MNSMNEITLSSIPQPFKKILIAMVITLTLGVSLGLIVVFFTTTGLPDGIKAHYQGDDPNNVDLIPDKYPMPVKELLITTHNHILSFTFIFGFLGFLIQLSRTLSSSLRQLLGIEPFISIILTFGSMWAIRFLSGSFVWLMLLSSALMYISFFVMIAIILWELTYKR
ncbi:MAG: hypothetical protein K9M49_04755 [Candidatus Marinimicrobia bacterium]|nr:hypothetical protein [Candidatus Neomarinimicrobiota bacterium]MCF7904448.1 hypothetical protein [Candidatus Neomarinimicrobiota bacterium]